MELAKEYDKAQLSGSYDVNEKLNASLDKYLPKEEVKEEAKEPSQQDKLGDSKQESDSPGKEHKERPVKATLGYKLQIYIN
jgi:hypothetical protein